MDFVKKSTFEKFSKKQEGCKLNSKSLNSEATRYNHSDDTDTLKALLYLILSLLFLILLPILISMLPIILATSIVAALITVVANIVTLGFLNVSIRRAIFYLSQIFIYIIMFIKLRKLPIDKGIYNWIYNNFLHNLNFPLYDYIYQYWTV